MNDISVSIVIPVYNEEGNLEQLINELLKIKEKLSQNTEIIFVDDCSTDKSCQIIENIALKDKTVKLISLIRNYGQTTAIASGIKNSNGEIIVTLDADLQNDPKDILDLLEKIKQGYDVVSGWRKNRKDPFFSRILPSKIANFLISFLTGVKLHDFGCTLKAYRREFVENISIHGEMHRFLPAYCVWQGAKITEIPVNHRERKHGKSKYGLGRIFKVILDMLLVKFILSYLSKPIYIFGGVSLITFFLGLIVNIFVILRKIFLGGEWLSPLFFAGFLLWSVCIISFLLGLLAEILIRIYFESREISIYKIKKKIN